MRYDISKPTAPTMPYLGKGTESIKIGLSQASKDMYETLIPMLFPVLSEHVSDAEFLVSRLHLEGTDGLNGQSGGRFGL